MLQCHPNIVQGEAGDSANPQCKGCNQPGGYAMLLQGMVSPIQFVGESGYEAESSGGGRYLEPVQFSNLAAPCCGFL